ncbi:hypothetical protein AYL99_02438 [Fonsecaea erecta]|uniref:N-acetyltransferase domain-containing protein n=1 Tax=Fonsecaea erecta TaxID=1367422 RepID=A0A178ZUS5_9EURO|nr:hypothetical protein AYL99_02438 [Fonsecaea erecta]OAP63211.1 hypothetical protein AYL99_02438 [Fonsecaea erecta]
MAPRAVPNSYSSLPGSCLAGRTPDESLFCKKMLSSSHNANNYNRLLWFAIVIDERICLCLTREFGHVANSRTLVPGTLEYFNSTIRPVSSSDLPLLSELVHTCKLALPVNRLLFKDWPNNAAQRPLYAAAVESAFKGESVDSLKAVDQESGDILGHLALTRKRPLTQTKTQPPSGKGIRSEKQEDIPDFFNPELLSAVSNAVSEIAKGTEEFDHFELSYICVKPSARRQGTGSSLVHFCLEKAVDGNRQTWDWYKWKSSFIEVRLLVCSLDNSLVYIPTPSVSEALIPLLIMMI